MVRETVLKLKDPKQILEEIFKIDLLELDSGPMPLPTDKALKEKKKKLKETLDRVTGLYEKTDKDKFVEIKKLQAEYERERQKSYFAYQSKKLKEAEEEEERRRAEEAALIRLPEIPLPQSGPIRPADIPLPMPAMQRGMMPPGPPPGLPPGSHMPFIPGLPPGLVPPGPPPGSPPHFDDDDMHDLDSSSDDDDDDDDLSSHGSEDDERDEALEMTFDPDQEEHGKEHSRREEKRRSKHKRSVRFAESDDTKHLEDETEDRARSVQQKLRQLAGHDVGEDDDESGPSQSTNPGMPFYPRPPMGIPGRGMPPGPPPGRPPGPPPGVPPPRLPPGMVPPPRPLMPGMPPPMGLPPRPPGFMPPPMQYGAMLSKPPELSKQSEDGEGTTISAKPQIRNIRAEVTKLVPTALRVRRADKGSKQKKGAATTLGGSTEPSSEGGQGNMAEEPTKDDVYSQFMKEMEGFL
eukprot:Seg1421.11 transcript_id=Seg1421.11/GoldUCD/mRNA.D3Y31 product="WW domain-binding protein 11" protein_id=Seg1421.11/GoldUCD/D3Y31